jgi:MFS family permease
MSRVGAVWQLYLFYGIAAIGVAGGYVPLTSTISRWFAAKRGAMTGIVVSGISVGTMVIPLVANRLIYSYGWRDAYIIIGIIALISVVSAAQFLRRDPRQVGLSSYGTKDGEEISLQASGFSLQEAMHTKQFWMLISVFSCFFFGVSTIMAHVVIHARGLEISPTGAALILTIIGGVGIGGRIMMGRAADRIGNKLAIIISIIMIAASFFLLLGAKETWMFYLFAALLGVGYGTEAALLSPIVAEFFGLSSLGGILGGIALGTQAGGAIGPVLAGRIYDVYGSYYLAFLICAILSIVALILALRLKPVAGKGGTDDSKRGT